MQASPQFTRNADGYFLETQLTSSLNFLLVTTNEDLFYQLRIQPDQMPHAITHILPTIKHLYLYLLKNHNHPRAFHIDSDARLHITVPVPNDIPVTVVLSTNQITKDSIMSDPTILTDQIDGKMGNGSIDDYFPKKRKNRQQDCMDLQKINETSASIEKPQIDLREKNKMIIGEVLRMLSEGESMGLIKRKLRLSDRTAFKMYRQWQKHKQIFSPEKCQILKQNKTARNMIRQVLQQDHNIDLQSIQNHLKKHDLVRSASFIQRVVSHYQKQIVFFSSESGSNPEN